MALTEQGIARARDVVNNAATYTGANADYLYNELYFFLTSFIEEDAEFVKFTQGTKYGAEFYQKWNELVRLIGVDYTACKTDLDIATNKFLDEQEQYNNMKMN